MTNKPSLETLFKLKRPERPSDGFWDEYFNPAFSRKMMATLSKTRKRSRAWTFLGWGMPFVFALALFVAFGIAWIFSPERSIARWEASTNGREYVVDRLNPKATHGYKIQEGQNLLWGRPTGGLTVYHFTSGESGKGEF